MNYRHGYHAGNFADVVKHIVLISLLEALKQKDKPFCYLDTHAGAGSYDLHSAEAHKTQEYKNGILKIFNETLFPNVFSNTVSNPLDIIKSYKESVIANGYPNCYPGSPLIAATYLRSNDRMVLMELHPAEVKNLKDHFRKQRNVAVHHQDGYEGLNAFLPPKEKRGLILMDPPFENTDEWQKVIFNVHKALKRFPSGIFAIWYPLKDNHAVQGFHEHLKRLEIHEGVIKESVIIELSIYPVDVEFGLNGCGMAIINPPWQWKEKMNEIIPWLWKVLAHEGQGSWKVSGS